jgi:hypothetical protein
MPGAGSDPRPFYRTKEIDMTSHSEVEREEREAEERERKREKHEREERDREEREEHKAKNPIPAPPPAETVIPPLPPVPPGDFTTVQQIVIPEAEILGTVPQGRHCTGSAAAGTPGTIDVTGIDFTQPNALCIVIQIPLNLPDKAKGWCAVYEYGGTPQKRWATLSETPFNWDGMAGWADSVVNGQTGVQMNMQVGLLHDDPTQNCVGVVAGKTYYLNVSNHDPKVPKAHGASWNDPRNVGVEMSAIRPY